jgi:hypothetical protein
MASAFADRVVIPDASPRETLLWMIGETRGEAAYYTLMIAQVPDKDLWGYHEAFVDRPLKKEKGAEHPSERVQEIRTSEPRLHIWINARAAAFDRLARYIKIAEDIGIAEREIELAERHGAQIADMLGAVLEGLVLTAAQREKAPVVIEGAMRQLEAGSTPLAA